MFTFSDFTYKSTNGKNDIRVRRCDPSGPPRGVLQIAHGIAEHSERYDGFAAFMAERGFVTVANDHLGHGKSILSEDHLGFFEAENGWMTAVRDMNLLHDRMMREFPGVPYFLFGHSMGSLLARTYILYHRTGLDGVILSGTGRQPGANIAAGRAIGKRELRRHGAMHRSERLNSLMFRGYNDGINTPRTEFDWLSTDPGAVDRYICDPLCGQVITTGLFLDLMDGFSIIQNRKKLRHMKKDMPVFFISGDKDPVGGNGEGVIRVYKSFLNAGMTNVILKLYHDGRHELLSEPNKEDVYRDIISWIEGILPA